MSISGKVTISGKLVLPCLVPTAELTAWLAKPPCLTHGGWIQIRGQTGPPDSGCSVGWLQRESTNTCMSTLHVCVQYSTDQMLDSCICICFAESHLKGKTGLLTSPAVLAVSAWSVRAPSILVTSSAHCFSRPWGGERKHHYKSRTADQNDWIPQTRLHSDFCLFMTWNDWYFTPINAINTDTCTCMVIKFTSL